MLTVRRLVVVGLVLAGACGKSGGGDEGGGSGSGDAGSDGATGSTSTDGGPGGSGGAEDSPTGGGSAVGVCIEHCRTDVDCQRDGQDAGFYCRDGDCTRVPECAGDEDCLHEFYADLACQLLEECGDGEICADLGGGIGACLRVPDAQFPCSPNEAERMLPPVEGGNLTTVCVWSSRCDSETSSCRAVCASDQACGPPDRICDIGTGDCVCTGDAACQGQFTPTAACKAGVCACTTDMDCQPGLSRCLADGTCGCGSDAECLQQSTQTDTCVDGVCGCSGDAACPPRFAAMDATCEPR